MINFLGMYKEICATLENTGTIFLNTYIRLY